MLAWPGVLGFTEESKGSQLPPGDAHAPLPGGLEQGQGHCFSAEEHVCCVSRGDWAGGQGRHGWGGLLHGLAHLVWMPGHSDDLNALADELQGQLVETADPIALVGVGGEVEVEGWGQGGSSVFYLGTNLDARV